MIYRRNFKENKNIIPYNCLLYTSVIYYFYNFVFFQRIKKLMVVFYEMSCIEPVSYTHLDVYKRQ